MRNRPIIQRYSDDAPRHRESSRPKIAIRLSATVVFGAVVYAAIEVGQPGIASAGNVIAGGARRSPSCLPLQRHGAARSRDKLRPA